jgi:hypothetical protein
MPVSLLLEEAIRYFALLQFVTTQMESVVERAAEE